MCLTRELQSERLRLYHIGMTDHQIAKIEGINPASVTNWRIAHDLPTKYPKYSKSSTDEFMAALEEAILEVEMEDDE